MGDIDGGARSENGENAGLVEASGLFRHVLNLEVDVSRQV